MFTNGMTNATDTDTLNPAVGDFLAYTLVTDTRVVEVVKVTASTITIRTTRQGEVVKRENRDGNPYPCIWTEAVADPDGRVDLLRRRKDGTFRIARWANRMHLATMIDGKPATFTDYRY